VGIVDRLVRRSGSQQLSLRPVTEPVVAVVAAREHAEGDPRVSVRVEVVASPPAEKPSAAAPAPSAPATSLTAVEARARPRNASERAQLMAAGVAAVTSCRGVAAYRAARDAFDVNALTRGVCVRVRA
jgi:hypothetical protein